jgi:predicted DNA-binding ArsR family transcriptional regulator
MADEVVTHAEVLRWLPSDVQRELLMSLSPEQRGWYTAAEAEEDGGRFVEVRKMCEREERYIRTGD